MTYNEVHSEKHSWDINAHTDAKILQWEHVSVIVCQLSYFNISEIESNFKFN